MSTRSDALAVRLAQGAQALAAFAGNLTESEWQTAVPHDGRTIGVIVHHVGSVYPIEIHIASELAAGRALTGVTAGGINEMNAEHARTNGSVTKADAIDLLVRNSADAATAIRAFSDAQLDGAATVSLYSEAPLTCQFVLEDHAVRHSYHHLTRIRGALQQ